jgi:glycosyltransferase involved in cell wall biosynthesis
VVHSHSRGRSEIIVVIPAFNEEAAIGKVLAEIPENVVSGVVVVNNNSSDETAEIARKSGAIVLDEPRQGYGFACRKGLEYLSSRPQKPDIVVYMDADYADNPREISELVRPIVEQDFDLVIGARTKAKREKNAMPFQQILGNWLGVKIIRLLYRFKFNDLGPFRAIKFDCLTMLNLTSTTYGWPVEMQLKAVKKNFRIVEVPVSCRKRTGKSKISGTFKGTIGSAYQITKSILSFVN